MLWCSSENRKGCPTLANSYIRVESDLRQLAYTAAKEERIPDDLWVQCDFPQCLKWRKMPRGTDPSSLPDNWFCYNHPDPAVAVLSHSAPEEVYKVPAEAEVGSWPVAPGLHYKSEVLSSIVRCLTCNTS